MQNASTADALAAGRHAGTLRPDWEPSPLVEFALAFILIGLMVGGAITLHGLIVRRQTGRGLRLFLATAVAGFAAFAALPAIQMSGHLEAWNWLLFSVGLPVLLFWTVGGIVAAAMALIERRRLGRSAS